MDNSPIDGLRRRFWQFVHDRLEDAWHWVYYHKLTPPVNIQTIGNVQYKISYICGRTGLLVTAVPPANTENIQIGDR